MIKNPWQKDPEITTDKSATLYSFLVEIRLLQRAQQMIDSPSHIPDKYQHLTLAEIEKEQECLAKEVERLKSNFSSEEFNTIVREADNTAQYFTKHFRPNAA